MGVVGAVQENFTMFKQYQGCDDLFTIVGIASRLGKKVSKIIKFFRVEGKIYVPVGFKLRLNAYAFEKGKTVCYEKSFISTQ